MKSPIATALLCLLLILLAGVPLLVFSSPHHGEAGRLVPVGEQPTTQNKELCDIPLLVRYTDSPVQIRILHMGEELCCIDSPGDAGRWQGKIRLPKVHSGAVMELEVSALWSDSRIANRAITLELSPPSLPTARDTAWTDPGAKELHNLFIFRW